MPLFVVVLLLVCVFLVLGERVRRKDGLGLSWLLRVLVLVRLRKARIVAVLLIVRVVLVRRLRRLRRLGRLGRLRLCCQPPGARLAATQLDVRVLVRVQWLVQSYGRMLVF